MKRVSFISSTLALLLSLLITPLASAQGSVTSLPGISVLGVGQVSVPAETATIVLMLGSGEYGYEKPMPMDGQAEASPAAPVDEMVAPVIEALTGAGVPAEDIELFSNPFTGDYGPYGGPSMATLVFTMEAPDAEQISFILKAAIDAATANGMYVNMTSALYGIADCAGLERSAREAAVADARETAAIQAELLDVALGDVVASRDDTYGAVAYGGMYGAVVQNNSCTLGGDPSSMTILYSAPAFDPAVEPMVSISSHIELTFEIADPA